MREFTIEITSTPGAYRDDSQLVDVAETLRAWPGAYEGAGGPPLGGVVVGADTETGTIDARFQVVAPIFSEAVSAAVAAFVISLEMNGIDSAPRSVSVEVEPVAA